MIHAKVHINLGGTGHIGNRQAAARDALTNGAIAAAVAGAPGHRFMPAANCRVAAIYGAWVSIVAVSGCTGLAGSAAAVVTDRTRVVVVAGDGG